MAGTHTSLYSHIIFSTKNHVKSTDLEIEKRVWAYIRGDESIVADATR